MIGLRAGVARASVTFLPELLREFDELARRLGYVSRSQAISDAVRLFMAERPPSGG